MAEHPDVLIIGGGVIGLTTAYYLAREGVRLALFDQGDLGRQASWAGAGIIPPGNAARARTPYDELRGLSAHAYPELSRDLLERTGIDNGYRVCGGIDLIQEGEAFNVAAWREEGIAFEFLDAAGLRRKEPGLAPGNRGGVWFPEMAQVRNPRHLKALIAGCTKLGIELRPGCPVRRFIHRAGRVVGVETDQGAREARWFVLACGAWADQLLAPLGVQLGVWPVRGQIVLLNTGIVGTRPILELGKNYLVPRGDGRVLVGSTEEDVGYIPCTTADAVRGLIGLAVTLLPSLAEAQVEHCWAGLRPGSPDGMPFIGSAPGYDNLLTAVGHFRSGLQLSPVTAQLLAERILGMPEVMSMHAFRLDRPPCPARQPAFRS